MGVELRAHLVLLMVAAAGVVVLPAAASRTTPVPSGAQRQIVAYFGRTYLPGWLPPGYVFAKWHSQAGSASAYGESLVVDFGKHGDQVQWTVGDAADPAGYGGDACSSHPYGARYIRVGTRRIVFQSGNHGATATLCVRSAHGVTAITVWNVHTLSPRAQAQIAASARIVG